MVISKFVLKISLCFRSFLPQEFCLVWVFLFVSFTAFSVSTLTQQLSCK